jgi:Tfp pilus assembly protein PilP
VTRTQLLAAVLLLLGPLVAPPAVDAQAPATGPGVGAAAAAPVLPGPDIYTYDPSGRRDPFVSLVARGADSPADESARGEGLAGIAVAELSVRGLLQSRGGYVAIVQGADTKTHVVRPGDRLLDGVVRSVTAQGLVILQQVNDPLSLVKQKEIRKGLRGSDEGK